MSKPKKSSVTIREWDGDRGTAVGGFDIFVGIGGHSSKKGGPSYDTTKERRKCVRITRSAAAKIAKSLGVTVTEVFLSR